MRLVLFALLLACTRQHVHRAAGPMCSTDCRANQYCYVDDTRPVAYDNPRCELMPAACTNQPDCECLSQQLKMSVCDDTGATPYVTLEP